MRSSEIVTIERKETIMATQRKVKVLFVCIHNSARSQMAAAFLNQIAGDGFDAQSAGLEPGTLNPLAVEVMKEVGIDISANRTNSVFDFFKNGSLFDYVITVCDGANAERCPVFPGVTSRVHWSFADPAAIDGEWEHRLAATRLIRDEIRSSVISFISKGPVE
jgi:arsenate reductase